MKFPHQVLCVLPVVILVWGMLPSPAEADDFSMAARPLGGAHLPKTGVATYDGTFAATGAWANASGAVQLFVDFGTGGVSADLTIPSLGTGTRRSRSARSSRWDCRS